MTEPERSPGGSPIYRHEARADQPPVALDNPVLEAVTAHVERHIGPVDTVLHEIVSTHVHLDVLRVDPQPGRPGITLVTCGMSAKPMTVPAEAEGAADRAELVMVLPPDWPLDEEPWPVELLKFLARLPHEYGTWLGWGHTIPNGDPPEPFVNGTGLCGAILLNPVTTPEAFSRSGDTAFHGVVLLHAAEMEFKLRHGTDALLDRFDEVDASVSEILALGRPSAVESERRRGLLRRRRR